MSFYYSLKVSGETRQFVTKRPAVGPDALRMRAMSRGGRLAIRLACRVSAIFLKYEERRCRAGLWMVRGEL